jgi:hypothetical protein
MFAKQCSSSRTPRISIATLGENAEAVPAAVPVATTQFLSRMNPNDLVAELLLSDYLTAFNLS